MDNLWSQNTPSRFWCCTAGIPDKQWERAIKTALPKLGISLPSEDINTVLEYVLGERQFGEDYWRLSLLKRMYYLLKPIIPRWMIRKLRQSYNVSQTQNFPLGWPVEDRYVQFQWQIMKALGEITNLSELPFVYFWPRGYQCAFVLTHDIETARGQEHAWRVLELESKLGYRSTFNFIPERYPLDFKLMDALRSEGFEIGVHGLKHDGKLFSSQKLFLKRSIKINQYLKDFDAVGFRAPLTHRQPEWMQSLNIEYDLSYFDTDPFEPIPGGTMSIWPFQVGRFIEMPYTLVQDYSIFELLNKKDPNSWMEKVDFLEKHHGLILLNTHPDYLLDSENWDAYSQFLKMMRDRNNYWHSLPRETARWWRRRMTACAPEDLPESVVGKILFKSDSFDIEIPS